MIKKRIEYYSDGRMSRGNNKFQTFKICAFCEKEFGPIDRLSKKFCTKKCWYSFKSKEGRKIKWIPTKEALRAQRMISYRVKKRIIKKPKNCEFCGKIAKLEGAHHDYAKPLEVKWLCISCHRKYDKKNKKHGAVKTVLERWQNYTGKKAERLNG